jgi:predicted S18 family serine protease
MNRIAFNAIVRAARVNPAIRSTAPYRWQSTNTAVGQQSQGSSFAAGAAGGLAVLLGGFAWYHFSGTRQVVNTARDGLNKAKELKDKVKETAGDSADSAANTVNYLRSATATLIPGSAPFLGKVFDQIEQISKEHGDDVKKIFEDTYKDFEKLTKEGGLDSQTASKAVDILQKRVKELQELAGDVGGDAYNKLVTENPKLKDQISEQYNKLKELTDKAKEKKPEVQKLLTDTSSELAKIFKDNGVSEKTVKQAQELLKKKAEEAKKIAEDVTKDAKGAKDGKDGKDSKDDKKK